MQRALAAVVVGILLLSFAVTPGVGAGAGSGSGFLAAQSQVDPDTVFLRIDLTPSGDANWTVEYRIRLDDDNASRAFDSLQADVRANRSAYTAQFADRMTRTIQRAEETTGREMALADVGVTATRRQLPQEYGVLAYTFTWEGFAVTEDGTIRAGDAVAGLFLDEETTLLVSWPAGYGLVEAAPANFERRDTAIVWEGSLNFASGEPAVVVAEGDGTVTTAGPGSPGGTTATTTAPPDDRAGLPWGLIAAMAVFALASLVGGGWYYRRSRGDAAGSAGAAATDRDELLSNEERVLALMEEHGGRMKQQEVASSLGWTDAKTSQVVGDLRDAGELEGFRLGRENVLSLPDEDETGTGESES